MVKCAGLTEEVDAKVEALEGKDKHLNDVHERLDGLHRDFGDMVNMNHQLEANLEQVKDEATRGAAELADLKEAHEEMMAMHAGAQEEARAAQEALRLNEEQFPERLETSDLVMQLKESNSAMSDELAEKKQVRKIKIPPSCTKKIKTTCLPLICDWSIKYVRQCAFYCLKR